MRGVATLYFIRNMIVTNNFVIVANNDDYYAAQAETIY